MKRKFAFVFLTLFFFVNALKAQNDFKSEDDLKEKATQLFEEEKFVEAEPLYSQLLSLYPEDATYNYKYGACLLASNEDKSKSLPFLEFAVSKSGIQPLAYYYLGKANHLNYNFSKAVKYYSRFKTKASSSEQEKYQLDRKIEMCKNGNQLLSKLNEVQVLDRQVVSEKDFFRLYELEGINGKLIAKPADFQSKYDQKVNEKSVIYLPEDAKEVYYSSYGKKAESGLDIYKSIKLGDGRWSEGVSIGETINTPYDENYPFIHPDGKTLYFASKGHNSMGGYDLFKSELDLITNQWGTPENLDFAFCSTDDDILFVTDRDKLIAYFASNRTNAAGKYTVYKVLVDRKPIELAVIQGKFIAENNPELHKATITVVDKETNKTIGVYETNKKGEYSVEIQENGGTYQFTIETTEEAPIHTGVVNIPSQDEFEVLGQELRLVGQGDAQQLVIKNIFDGTTAQNLTSSGPQVSADILRAKANLDVNLSVDQLAALESKSETSTSGQTKSGESNAETNQAMPAESSAESTPELSASLELSAEAIKLKNQYEDKKEEQKQGINLKESKLNSAFAEAIQLEAKADKEFSILKDLEAKGSTNVELAKQNQKAKELALKAAFATEAAQSLESDLNNEEDKLSQLNQEQEGFEKLLQNNELVEAELKLKELSVRQEKSVDSDAILSDMEKETTEEKEITETALDASKAKLKTFKNEEQEVLTKISEIEKSISKGKGDTEALETQLEGLQMDSKDLAYQAQRTAEEIDQLENKKKALAVRSNQLDETRTAISSDEANNSLVSASDKTALIDKMKNYRDNKQLAYIGDERVESKSSMESTASNSNENTLNQVEEKYKKDLLGAEAIEDIDLRNARKIQIYDNWINELEAEMIEDEAQLSQTQTEKEKEALQNDIALLQQVIDQKTIIRDQAEENAAISSSVESELDADLAQMADVSEEYEDLNTELPKSVAEVDDLSLIPDDFTNFRFDQSIKFGNQRPSQVMSFAKKSLFEARELSLKAEKARQDAYNLPSAEERAAAFERANKFEEESEEKQLEAAEYFAEYNKTEYEINWRRLFNANQFEDEFESDDLDLANLLAEEGQVYYNSAAQIRKEVNLDDRLSQKEVALQKAYDYELLALKKQRQALIKISLVDDQYLEKLKEQTTSEGPAFVQSITDAKVLNVTQADVAQKRADSLYATVESLEEDAKQLLSESEKLPIGEERDAELSKYENVLAQIEQNKMKAAIYYERKKQLESGSTAGNVRFSEPADGLTEPYSSFKKEVVLDTVIIDDARKDLVLNSKAFVEYQKNKQYRDRIAKEASTEYSLALTLSEEKQQLEKQAIVAKNQAELETDETEKQRLIKSAEVIDQKIADKQVKIDSLNTSLKVKNYLMSTANQKMNNAITSLSEVEKKEIMQLARTKEEKVLASNEFTQEAVQNNDSKTPIRTDVSASQEVGQTDNETPELGSEVLAESASEIDLPEIESNDESNETKEKVVVELDETPAIVEQPTEVKREADVKSNEEIPTRNKPTENVTTPVSTESTSLLAIDDVPRQLKEAIFITLRPNESAYNSAKPIPTKSTLPEGLVYKVQVGAFRNPIPQDLFKGFAPLYAETTPSGITRYTAGLFKEEGSAIKARNEIRTLGYPDAFVVAFFNGERISVSQARGGSNAIATQGVGDNFTTDSEGTTAISAIAQPLSNQFNASDVAEVINAKTIEEVYYTVQIGVFSKPLKKEVFDFEQLNVVELPNGLIRYNAGIYESAIKAADVKNTIQNKIPDAFVTAYKKGNRISLNEASRLKRSGQ